MGIFGIGRKGKDKKQAIDMTKTAEAVKKDSAAETPPSAAADQEVSTDRGVYVDHAPLDHEDNRRLSLSGYDKQAARHQTVYVIQQDTPAPTTEHPNRVVRKVAELHAASAYHACRMIGWRSRRTTVVSTRRPKETIVEVLVNDKVAGHAKLPGDLELKTNKEVKDAARRFAEDAVKSEAVAKVLGGRKVKHVAFEPMVRLRLVTETPCEARARKAADEEAAAKAAADAARAAEEVKAAEERAKATEETSVEATTVATGAAADQAPEAPGGGEQAV